MKKVIHNAGLSITACHLDLVHGAKIVDDDSPLGAWIDLEKCTDIPLCTWVQHWGRIVADDGLFLGQAPEGCKADVDVVQKANGLRSISCLFSSMPL